MESTRRVWAVLAVAGAGAAAAALFSNRLLLVVPVVVGTWLLAHRLAFARAVTRIREAEPAVLEQSLTADTVHAGESTTLRVRSTDANDALAAVSGVLELRLPPSLVADAALTHRLSTAEETAVEVPIRAPIGGCFEVASPTVHVASAHALFHDTLRVGNACSIAVEPRVPEAIEAGPGGRRAETTGPKSGPTNLFVDRRASMRDGRPGETKLDYARELGLAVAERAADDGASLGLAFVEEGSDHPSVPEAGEAGSSDHGQYDRVRQRLADLVADSETASGDWAGGQTASGDADRRPLRVRREAVRRGDRLGTDDAFARTLGPYFDTMATYADRLATEPLFARVAASVRTHGADGRYVVVTDDASPEELLGTARLASVRGVELSMFVLPTAFFAARSAATVGTAVDAYREYQSLVRDLNEHDGVTAFEAGPQRRHTAGSARPARGVRQ
ncbi:MAG: hypothetical protein ACOCZD_00535 [Haloferacaceae archaeon]